MTCDEFLIGQMGGRAPTLRFLVMGKVASNNRVTRHFRGRAVKSEAARDYQSKVASYAIAAVAQQQWRWPAACIVRIVSFNGRVDVGNVEKVICDSLQGIAFPKDSRRFVRGVEVYADADGGEEYVEITVTGCDPIPEIVRRKCGLCLDIRPGVKTKPFRCGRCATRKRRAA